MGPFFLGHPVPHEGIPGAGLAWLWNVTDHVENKHGESVSNLKGMNCLNFRIVIKKFS